MVSVPAMAMPQTTCASLRSSVNRPGRSSVSFTQKRLSIVAPQHATQKRAPVCRASSSREPDSSPSVSLTLDELAKRWSSLVDPLSRYDFLSAGLGALAVTTVCVARGQDPGTALWITAASTVVALVVNDALFEKK